MRAMITGRDRLYKYFIHALCFAMAAGIMLWIINFPAEHNLIFTLVTQLACFLSMALLWAMPQQQLIRWIEPHFLEEKIWTNPARAWFLAGLALALAIFAYLEYSYPYYFMQNDNYDQFSPIILQAMRDFFGHGIFPTWSGYQYLGAPTTTLGYYSLTYPVLYLCYAVARFICGNEFLTMPIYVGGHLLAGYAMCFIVLRYLSLRPALAASAAFCCIIFGYNLIIGRFWHYIATNAFWMPAIGLSLVMFMHRPPTLRWVIGTGLAIGLYFYAGNIQHWSYGMMLWGLGILWTLACKPRPFRSSIVPLIMAVLIGFAVIAPLLIAMKIETADIPRFQIDRTIIQRLNSLLVPWRQEPAPSVADITHEVPPFYFAGGLFMFFFFLRMAFDIAVLARPGGPRALRVTSCFSFLALFALTLAIGARGMVWDWLAEIQPFSRFRMPFKIMPFLTFFAVLSGGLLMETALRRYPRHARGLGIVLSLIPVVLIVATIGYCKEPLWYNERRNPYPVMPAEYQDFQVTDFSVRGRVYPVYVFQPAEPDFPLTLALNYATIYRIPVPTGFNISNLELDLPETRKARDFLERDPVSFANEFGVEWVFISSLPHEPDFSNRILTDYYRSLGHEERNLGFVQAFKVASPATKPMAYVQAHPDKKLPYRIRADGLDIDLADAAGGDDRILIANFLYRPWFKASAGGKKLAIHPDENGRIAVAIPPGNGMLALRYAPPWHYGFYAALILLALTGLLGKFAWTRSE